MKKYITYAALLFTSGALLTTTHFVQADTITSNETTYAVSQHTSEKDAIDQLVREGKIKAEEADQVKLIGF